jgi:hypothetical protein
MCESNEDFVIVASTLIGPVVEDKNQAPEHEKVQQGFLKPLAHEFSESLHIDLGMVADDLIERQAEGKSEISFNCEPASATLNCRFQFDQTIIVRCCLL